jgi:hypothetical protein
MRRTKTPSGLGVEVLIEGQRISLGWIVLEAGIWAVRRPPVIRVEQKQPEQTVPELRSHLVKIRPRARSGRQFDRQILAEKVEKNPSCSSHKFSMAAAINAKCSKNLIATSS